MAYLEIDGLVAPVVEASPTLSTTEIGSFARAVSGAGILSRQGVKRAWDVATTPYSEVEARAWEAILLAKGLLWQFAGDSCGSNGYVPATITNNTYVTARATATPTYPTSDAPFGQDAGMRAVALDVAATNELTQNQSTWDTDTTGAASIDSAVLTQLTTPSLDGDGALRVVTSASVNSTRGGVRVGLSYAATTKVAGSVYVMATTAVAVTAELHAHGEIIVETLTLVPYRWTRFCLGAEGTSGTSAFLYVYEAVADSGVTFYIDHLQIDRGTEVCSEWIIGGTTRATSGRLQLTDAGFNSFADQDWSMSFWIPTLTNITANPPPSRKLFLFEAASGDYIEATVTDITSGPTTEYETLSIEASAGGETITLTSSDLPSTADTWRHVVMTVSRDSAGDTAIALYVNGVLEDADTISRYSADFLSLVTLASIDIGSDGTTTAMWGRPIAQLMFLPCAVPTGVLASLYNSGAGCVIGDWPKHRMTGDVTGDERPIDVYVQMLDSEPVDHADANGVWQAGRKLRYRLLEA